MSISGPNYAQESRGFQAGGRDIGKLFKLDWECTFYCHSLHRRRPLQPGKYKEKIYRMRAIFSAIRRYSNKMVLVSIMAVATALAGSACVIGGRLAGLCITALCGLAMAYFLMPPFLSLHVSQTHDVIALAFYGIAGLVFVRATPSARNHKALPEAEPAEVSVRLEHIETDLSTLVSELMSSDTGVAFRKLSVEVACDRFELPCTHEEALQILSDLLTVARRTVGVERVSFYGSERPGNRCLKMAAHHVFPIPPDAGIIVIGKREEYCRAATFAGWPAAVRSTWFDNGYDRIVQVSFSID
jgi:hypothetical protein